ncbi:hypothetical protein JHK87_007448 [Glycine soja]|nr:hypothetical protein JHK87_007448 [Glycine soja]
MHKEDVKMSSTKSDGIKNSVRPGLCPLYCYRKTQTLLTTSSSAFSPLLVLFPLDSFVPIACHSDLLPHTGKLSQTIYGCGASIVFCGYIIYDTERLIKRFSYEEQIWASVSLYADIINLFVSLLTAFRAAN